MKSIALLAFTLLAASAFARTRYYSPPGMGHVVFTTADSGDGSLRKAVADARYGDVIMFDEAMNGQTIVLTSGEIIIDKGMIIRGSNITITRANGPKFRIFNVQAGTVVMTDLTISNGYADASYGGGILNRTNLTLLRCHITQNTSDAGDGGGGIWNIGELYLEGCTVDNNRAIHTFGFPVGYGGGIKTAGILTLTDTTVTENLAELRGGGIYCTGALSLTQSTVTGNTAPEGANIYGCSMSRAK